MKKKIVFLCCLLVLVIFWGISSGSSNLTLSELMRFDNRNIMYLRLARVLTAIITGVGLSVSGIALQAVLRNPLAEPYLLGTSSGAGLGAVLGIVTGISAAYIPLAAFLGAALTVILVYNLARRHGRIDVQTLILSGVIISIAFSGIIVLLLSLSSNEALHGAMFWLWGSTQVTEPVLLAIATFVVVSAAGLIFFFAQDLNAISTGEESALHLGVDSETVKKAVFFITSLVTASLVSLCGIIGFVGLVIPHMMRMVVGVNHKVLIPASCITAAIFMVACDILSRTLLRPLEIPIGVITALIGAPVFIILLLRKTKI